MVMTPPEITVVAELSLSPYWVKFAAISYDGIGDGADRAYQIVKSDVTACRPMGSPLCESGWVLDESEILIVRIVPDDA